MLDAGRGGAVSQFFVGTGVTKTGGAIAVTVWATFCSICSIDWRFEMLLTAARLEYGRKST